MPLGLSDYAIAAAVAAAIESYADIADYHLQFH